jgi:hypothetical protein
LFAPFYPQIISPQTLKVAVAAFCSEAYFSYAFAYLTVCFLVAASGSYSNYGLSAAPHAPSFPYVPSICKTVSGKKLNSIFNQKRR